MRVLIAAALTAIALPAIAQEQALKDMIKAREAGQIIGTAGECGYKLDDGKVAAFAAETIGSMDPGARGAFQSGSGAHKIRMQKMSSSEKAATCAIQEKVAKQYGLTP